MRLRVGNVTGSQRLTIHRLTAYASGRDGDIVAGEPSGWRTGAAGVPHRAPYVGGSLVASAGASS